MDGVFAFSTVPLRLATWIGFVVVGLSLCAGLFIVGWRNNIGVLLCANEKAQNARARNATRRDLFISFISNWKRG